MAYINIVSGMLYRTSLGYQPAYLWKILHNDCGLLIVNFSFVELVQDAINLNMDQ